MAAASAAESAATLSDAASASASPFDASLDAFSTTDIAWFLTQQTLSAVAQTACMRSHPSHLWTFIQTFNGESPHPLGLVIVAPISFNFLCRLTLWLPTTCIDILEVCLVDINPLTAGNAFGRLFTPILHPYYTQFSSSKFGHQCLTTVGFFDTDGAIIDSIYTNYTNISMPYRISNL